MDYIVIWVQVDGVQGYDEDQIALVILDLLNFAAWVPVILGTSTINHVINMIKEKEIDALGKSLSGLSFSSLMSYSHSGK